MEWSTRGANLDRRRFLKAASGLFVPAIPAIIRPEKAWAQLSGGVGGFPGPGMAGSAIPSNPSAIFGANLLAWYDPTRNFSGAAWNDQSGNGYNLSSVGSPTYSATAFNSRPGVTLNGTSQYFATSSQVIAAGGSATMAFWMVFNPTATPAAFGRFLTTIPNTASRFDYDGTGSGVVFCRNNTATSLCGFADGGAAIPLGNFAISYGTNFIASMIFDGTNTISYLSNVQQTSTANTRPPTWGTMGLCMGTTLTTNVGSVMQFGTDWGKGVFAEIVMVKGTITSQNRTDMNAWLKYNNGL